MAEYMVDVKETVMYNLNKNAIRYEFKTKRHLLVDSKHRPTIKWLLWIFTDAYRINHTEEKDKFKFRLENDYLNISFI
tara:strand:- start:183 stop:416 length:234 start_codon:yes stop_codon:yes gene_type:complete